MKDTVKKTYLTVLLAALALAFAGTVTRTVLLLTAYDASLGHFEDTVLSSVLFPLIPIIAAVFYFAFGILMRTELDGKILESSLLTVFSAAFAAVAGAVWIITHISLVFSAEGISLAFGILMLICAVGLIFYFVLTALGTKNESLQVLTCLCAVLFCVFYILFAYFDTAFVLNSPIKVFDQVVLLCLILFFLAECRFSFGAISYAAYLPVTLLAATVTMINAFPALIYAVAEGEPLLGDVMHDFLILAFFLYATARLITALGRKTAEEEPSAYADELAQKSDAVTDIDTHIALADPDQEAFDFNENEEDEDATEAQTTLDFPIKKDR